MGNILRSGGLLSNGGTGDDPCHVQLGKYAAIALSERQVMMQQNGGVLESWNITYEVGASACALQLTRECDYTKNVKGLRLQLRSETTKRSGDLAEFDFFLDVQTINGDDFVVSPRWFAICGVHTTTSLNQHKRVNNKTGSVSDMDMYLYGEGHKGGFIVLERKKKSGHLLPFEVTLAHYHATGSGINDYRKIKPDFGLSMVAKIRSIGGNLTIMVDGPEQHPSSALLYMFDEVSRNGYWHRDMCPHCAKNPKKQNREQWQSESEDSDSTPKGVSLGGSGKNVRVISNGGKFGGDGNGNFYERNVFNVIYQHQWSENKSVSGRTYT
ncbi:uncharacterized protein LOC114182171 [Vigna unguiculata]|uniref:uncharacterized protein LOC114182171 n=1 Tax=Vigna unguiculata TaxID=3917 RepID=UPI00101642F0|nr:uncharacterized protein LOC114182171 [Vigna unguiculata]